MSRWDRVTPGKAAVTGIIAVIGGLSLAAVGDYHSRLFSDISVGLISSGLVLVGLALEGTYESFLARIRAERTRARSGDERR